MTVPRPVRASVLIAAAAMALALTACSSPTSGPTTPSPSASDSSSPSSTSTATPRPTGTSTATPIDGQCATSDLSGAIGPGAGGAAGSIGVTIVLTNTGSSSCDLQGWPGVSFVGDGNGTQLGKSAELDRSTPHPTVTLAPGGKASAPLKITQAGNLPEEECKPKTADGFRVYPPGSTASLFIKTTDYTACTVPTASLLSVGALVAG